MLVVEACIHFLILIMIETTRWGDARDNIKYPTKEPLLANQEKQNFPIFFEEADCYTWICYMELQ